MSGHPTEIKLHQQSRVLEITYGDDANYMLPYEFLRVYSPSAEVRGHGVGQGTLQVGKKNVGVLEVLPVGNYAMKIVFDDGHDSGLYSWDYLYNLGKHQADLWQEYLAQLAAVGASREPGNQPETKKSGCGSGCGHA
ncbi:MAG: DUF971 domain-containing protein [Gallionella sp.]|nr:DUF971 domain-containing protein [Gallionella sp.]